MASSILSTCVYANAESVSLADRGDLWSVARSMPRLLVFPFGIAPEIAELIGKLSLAELDRILACHCDCACPRCPQNRRFWDMLLTRTMVDYAKTTVYRYHRRVHIFERQSRDCKWTFIPPSLTANTSIGILGLGELGREIALALQREGFDVHGWSRTPKQLKNVTTYTGQDGLKLMVGCSDIVLNVLPLTDKTRHILCRDLFAQFRDGTCLINMGRGMHLVESDLLDAIASGKVEAATLDVFSSNHLRPCIHFGIIQAFSSPLTWPASPYL
jgi:hypothetical protein